MRSLSADEQALWEQVAATIRPLSREPVKSSPEPKQSPVEAHRTIRARPSRSTEAALAATNTKAQAPKTLDSTWDRRLRSGAVQPDRVIDLHGCTLDTAWSAIDRGLERAIAGKERVVLLITGHARPGGAPVERGKIRAAVHHWLEASRHAPRIAAVRGAHGRHGGGGSLYIILRRDRSKSTLS